MAFSERYVDTGGSNLNGGFPTGGAYPVTSTNGAFTQGGGAGGNDRFTAAAGTPFSGCAVDDCVASFADGAAAPTGYVGVITAINGGGASIDLHLTRFAGTRPTTGASGRTAVVGGAWAGPTGTTSFPFNFVTTVLTNAALDPVNVNFAAGTWNTTGNLTHTLAGPVRFTGTLNGSNQPTSNFRGAATGASYIGLTCSGTNTVFANFDFAQNGDTGTTGSSWLNITGTNCEVTRCRFHDCWRDGLLIAGGGAIVTECEAHNCNLDDASDFGGFGVTEESTWIRCWTHHNSIAPSTSANGMTVATGAGEPLILIDCLFTHNGKHGCHSPGGSVSVFAYGCVFANNDESGFNSIANASTLSVFENCIFSDNADYGIEYFAASGRVSARNCGFFSNGIAPTLNVNASFLTGTITFSADPFVDATNGDYDLNTTAGGGADARNAGIGTFLEDSGEYSGVTLGYPSLGAAEPDAAAPGGGQTSYTFG